MEESLSKNLRELKARLVKEGKFKWDVVVPSEVEGVLSDPKGIHVQKEDNLDLEDFIAGSMGKLLKIGGVTRPDLPDEIRGKTMNYWVVEECEEYILFIPYNKN